MRLKIYFSLVAVLLLTACKKDFLDRFPQDDLSDDTYWSSENNVRTFAWGFYPGFFSGYGSSSAAGRYFNGQSLNDDFAASNPPQFTRNLPNSAADAGWSFSDVRKANLFLKRIQQVPMPEEAIKHWSGVARFFRGLEYFTMVRRFGDVPWYSQELFEYNIEELYKPRDPRTLVMDSVLEDFKYAAANVRATDGIDGQTINKYVVLAFMSRVFLFEGTFLKYHNIDATRATTYLEAAKWAANEVIASGKYQVAPDYRGMFTALNLAGNKEMILYRQYEPGILTHSLNSLVNKEPQTGASKNAIDSYLAKDGLPISLSPLYKGDKTIANVMADRDPRITETFVPQLRLNGIAPNYSSSGYATHKFLNEAIKDLPEGTGALNPTDAPIIRYGEVLLNYAEAAAELGTIKQDDLDKSINLLRKRADVNIPALQVIGTEPAVNGVIYDDPKRDQDVFPIIWEIRRERRVELMMEGFRLDDLKRWKKLAYADTKANIDINRGAWIKKSDYSNLKDVVVDNETTGEGYIIPAWRAESQREFLDEKVYLDPLPIDQIKLYKDQGKELLQNEGWE